jgi:hypothetical protein
MTLRIRGKRGFVETKKGVQGVKDRRAGFEKYR